MYLLTKNNLPATFKILGVALATVLISISGLAQTKSSLTHKTSVMAGAELGASGTTITMEDNPIHTVGKLPPVGTQLKNFILTGTDLKEKTLADFKGKYLVLNIFPSVNTGVCFKSVRTFNPDYAIDKNS